jgi:hypothetical protein
VLAGLSSFVAFAFPRVLSPFAKFVAFAYPEIFRGLAIIL